MLVHVPCHRYAWYGFKINKNALWCIWQLPHPPYMLCVMHLTASTPSVHALQIQLSKPPHSKPTLSIFQRSTLELFTWSLLLVKIIMSVLCFVVSVLSVNQWVCRLLCSLCMLPTVYFILWYKVFDQGSLNFEFVQIFLINIGAVCFVRPTWPVCTVCFMLWWPIRAQSDRIFEYVQIFLIIIVLQIVLLGTNGVQCLCYFVKEILARSSRNFELVQINILLDDRAQYIDAK